MKRLTKINAIALIALILLGCGMNTSCYCARFKQDVDGQTFTFLSDKQTQKRIKRLEESLKHRRAENPGVDTPVITGGRYKSVPHGPGYESHHLISSKFCEIHKDVISVSDAPAVLIPRGLHLLTGSHGGKSAQYVIQEEEEYARGGLQLVMEHGIKDLIRAMKEYYAQKVSLPISPIKRAKAMVQAQDDTAYPGEDLSPYVTTPLHNRAQSRLHR